MEDAARAIRQRHRGVVPCLKKFERGNDDIDVMMQA